MALFSHLCLRSHMRLFLTFILSFLLPLLVLTSVFLNFYQTTYAAEVQRSFCQEINSININMDTQLQVAATYAATIAQDLDLKQHLLSAVSPEEHPLPDDISSMSEIVYRYTTNKPSIITPQISVITCDGTPLIGQSYLGVLDDTDTFRERITSSYRSPLKNTFWFYEQQFHDVPEENAYIYVIRPVTNPNNWDCIGYVILRFRNSNLVSMYLANANEQRSIFVLDSNGTPISSVDNLSTRSFIVRDTPNQLLLINQPVTEDGKLIYTTRLSNLWYLIAVSEEGVTPNAELTAAITYYISALFLCILLTMTLSYIMSKHFMRPVKELTAKMHEAEEGNLHSRAIVNTHDEFEDLANSYNKMLQRVEELMRQIIREQEKKRESDIRMLQAQINPHFLYNTLTSIRYMIYTSSPAEVDRIILALSRFLKYVLSNAETVYVSLEREFEQMRDYIVIQQFGFDVPLQYSVDVEPGLGHYLVVKMLFQPLIENAILHGLKLNKVDPSLHISVHSVDDEIEIEISDNGIGFDVAALSKDGAEEDKLPYLGIANVQQRLQLHYGESGHFEISSKKGEGTTVRIRIPKLTEEDMNCENSDR